MAVGRDSKQTGEAVRPAQKMAAIRLTGPSDVVRMAPIAVRGARPGFSYTVSQRATWPVQ